MPINEEQQARLEFFVELDKRSYSKIQTSLGHLFKQRHELTIGEKGVEKLRDQLLEVMQETGPEFSKGLAESFDKEIEGLLKQFDDVQKKFSELDATASEAQIKALQAQQANIEKEMELAIKQHKAAQDLRKALKAPLKPETWKKAAEGLGEGFLSTLNKAKAGDIAGLTEALAGGIGKAVSAGGSAAGAAGAAAGEATAVGSALGALSGAAIAATAAIAAVAAAVVAVIAVVAMADEQAKEFNKTMLEGAGSADFALGKANEAGLDLNQTLSAGQDAAIEMALKWRGQAKDFTEMLGQLNQAGLTFKEMTKGAKTQEEVQERLADHMRVTTVASRSLGLSVSETAEIMAQWNADFGDDLKRTEERFAQVSEAAAASGMNTKRFFSAVSQATAGMSLYNVRMEDAAALLAKTSKILGDTDASDFIRSLTKGFADESYVDRFKRIMISGTDDVRKVMQKDSLKMARDFSRSFKDNAKVQQVFEDMKIDLTNPEALKEKVGKMTKKEVDTLVRTLHEQGEHAAARQIADTNRLIKSSQGGVTEMAKGLDELSMGGKLAMKMQGLGDKRLSEMSGIELAAFEQYSGIGGEQLEQLRKMDATLMSEWDAIQSVGQQVASGQMTQEEANKYLEQYNATVDAQGKIHDANGDVLGDIDDYTMASQARLTDLAEIQDENTYYAKESTKATSSILDYLQTGMAKILKDIYDVILEFWAKFSGTSVETLALQRQLKEGADKNIADLTTALDEQKAAIAEREKIIATKGKGSEEGKKAAAELERLQAEKQLTEKKLEHAEQFGREVMRNETAQQLALKYRGDGMAGSAGVGAMAVANPFQTWEDLKIATESADAQRARAAEIAALEASLADKLKPTEDQSAVDQAAADMMDGPWAPGYDPMAEAGYGVLLPEEAPEDPLMEDQTSLLETQDESLYDIYDSVDQALILDEKGARADKTWRTRDYEKKTTDAYFEAGRKLKATELAAKLGYRGEDVDAVAEAIMSGSVGPAVEARIAAHPELTADAASFGLAESKADDFVMRPGQPAQRFNSNDTIVGFKPGGPIAGAAGGGGTVNITINGGDQAKVYQTVKDALKNSGLR